MSPRAVTAAPQIIEDFVATEYKYGFVTDIDSESAPPGLNEDIIRLISKAWCLVFRSGVSQKLRCSAPSGLSIRWIATAHGWLPRRHLATKNSLIPWSQLVAVQHTEDRTRSGTAPARGQLRCNRKWLQRTLPEWTNSIREEKEKKKETLWLQKLQHSEALCLS